MVFIASRPPYHRHNRRRERPGARTRKALSNRESIQHDFDEGLKVARDCSLWLPSENYPLSTSHCWREGNQSVDLQGEDEQHRLSVEEQFRLFGGDVGDDSCLKLRLRKLRAQELRWMGILYEQDQDEMSNSQSTIKPEYYIRPARRTRQSRASRTQLQLPEYLATSLLSDNPSIAPWLLPQTATQSHNFNAARITIQHRPAYIFPTPAPQSLPSSSLADSVQPEFSRVLSPLLFPLERDDEDLADATWDFITNSTRSSAPPSEPETWILLSDDS